MGQTKVCCLSDFHMTMSPAGAGRVLVEDLLRQGSLASPHADRRRQVPGGGGADAGQATGDGGGRQRCTAGAASHVSPREVSLQE